MLSKIIYHRGKLQRKKSPLLRSQRRLSKNVKTSVCVQRRRRKGFQDDVDDKVDDGLFGRCRNADLFPARYLFSFLPSCFQDRPKNNSSGARGEFVEKNILSINLRHGSFQGLRHQLAQLATAAKG